MDDIAVDEEKKPFDALGGQNDEDLQPDPDEHIMLESGHGRVWLVKVSLHHPLDFQYHVYSAQQNRPTRSQSS